MYTVQFSGALLYTRGPHYRGNSLQGHPEFSIFCVAFWVIENPCGLEQQSRPCLGQAWALFSQCAQRPARFKIYRQKSRRFSRLPLWLDKTKHRYIISHQNWFTVDDIPDKELYFIFLKKAAHPKKYMYPFSKCNIHLTAIAFCFLFLTSTTLLFVFGGGTHNNFPSSYSHADD
jgi:hypothetical protein